VFIIKPNPDEILEYFKVRLVTRGFSQVYREDYTNTFALIIRIDILRIFLIIIAIEDLEYNYFNIKNTFTKSILKERIFLLKPKGIPIRDKYILRVL
jgi:hypothetical protein